jgi:thiol-disulfide isomerase/thioredoxin
VGGHTRVRTILRDILIAGLAIVAINGLLTRHAASGRAPSLPAARLNGPTPPLAAGRPVLIEFFATWCPICRLDQQVAQKIARHERVVVVATESPARAVRAFARAHRWQTPVIMDRHGALARRYGALVLPMAFVVGPKGHIRFVVAGYATEAGLMARLWWAGLRF